MKIKKKIIDVLKYLYNTVNYEFYDMDELLDNNDYDL